MKLHEIVDENVTRTVDLLPLDVAGDNWLEYLKVQPEADICHHPAWAQIFARTFGLESALVRHRTDGHTDGGVPLVQFDRRITGRAMISMPYLNYGGILADNDEVRSDIIAACRQLADKSDIDYLELRHTGWSIGDKADKKIHNRVTFRLDISRPSDEILKGLRRQTRTRIRRVIKQGFGSYYGRDRIGDFYKLFSMAMREHGTPVLPKRFFKLIIEHLGAHAAFMIAYKNDTPVGGKLVLTFKERASMVWGCFPDKYKHLLANYYLTWELIKQLEDSRVKILDFGRSPLEGGGHIYKSNWGPEKIPIHVDYIARDPERIPLLKPENRRFRPAIAIWKHLPLSITKMLGPKLARYFP